MRAVDHTFRELKRGPITFIFNGKGIHPWLPELRTVPGWRYLINHEAARVCWQCVHPLHRKHEGRAAIQWDDAEPGPDERCARCERGFGARE